MIVAVKKILLDDAAVAAIVATRIFINHTAQEVVMPALLLDADGTDPVDAKESFGKAFFWNLTINCVAENYTDVYALRKAVYDALQNFTGNVTLTSPAETIGIAWTKFEGQTEDFQEFQIGAHVIAMQWKVAVHGTGVEVQYPEGVEGVEMSGIIDNGPPYSNTLVDLGS